MESEYPGGITAALNQLENDILAHLNNRIASKDPNSAESFIWGGSESIKPPEAYILYRRLKLYAGRDGTIPFLWNGGYMDQPYMGTLVIERCEVAAQNFQTILSVTIPQKSVGPDDEQV